MKRTLAVVLLLLTASVFCYPQDARSFRADRVRYNPNVQGKDANGYSFRGHWQTEANTVVDYCAEADSLFARITDWGAVDSTIRKGLINTLIVQLKTDTIWSKLDVFYMLAAPSEQASLLNWVEDDNNCIKVLAPTFVADSGWASNGSGYLNTTFNPFSESTNYLLNAASTGSYALYNVVGDVYDWGAYNVVQPSSVRLQSRKTTLYASLYVNATTNASPDSPTAAGLHIGSRTNSTTITYSKNGAVTNTTSTNSTALTDMNIFICCLNLHNTPANFSTNRQAMFFMSGLLTVTQQLKFKNALETYLDAIGCGVIP